MILQRRNLLGWMLVTQLAIYLSVGARGATVQSIDDKLASESVKISGFGGEGTGWTVNGSAVTTPPFPVSNVLRLTDNNPKDVRSAFYDQPVLIVAGSEGFVASFTSPASRSKSSSGRDRG